tara:strand:- start:1451 stop:2152 length:702 start_codon:yes stop_codon:yes gene_type:complete
MATLTGNPIKDSYLGLIKTADNAAIGATAKAVTDGGGNATNIEITNTATNFVSGTVDFTGSTVSGLPSGGPTTSFSTGKVVNTSYLAQDIVQSVMTIPGGTYVPGDTLNIRSMETREGLNATQYTSMWLTPTAQTVGQAPASPYGESFTQIQSSGDNYGVMQRTIKIETATETNWLQPSGTPNDDSVTTLGGTNMMPIKNIDWTVNQYVYLQFYSDSSTGTYTNFGMQIRKLS